MTARGAGGSGRGPSTNSTLAFKTPEIEWKRRKLEFLLFLEALVLPSQTNFSRGKIRDICSRAKLRFGEETLSIETGVLAAAFLNRTSRGRKYFKIISGADTSLISVEMFYFGAMVY